MHFRNPYSAVFFLALVTLPLLGRAGMANRMEHFYCSISFQDNVMASAEFSVSEDGTALHYKLEVKNVGDITMAHLHLGRMGHIGSPVVWLYPQGPPPRLIQGTFTGILSEGTITSDDLRGPLRNRPLSVLLGQIKAGEVYINIHSREHPHGEICGPVILKGGQQR